MLVQQRLVYTLTYTVFLITCASGQALSPESRLDADVTAATADRTASTGLKRKLTEMEECLMCLQRSPVSLLGYVLPICCFIVTHVRSPSLFPPLSAYLKFIHRVFKPAPGP